MRAGTIDKGRADHISPPLWHADFAGNPDDLGALSTWGLGKLGFTYSGGQFLIRNMGEKQGGNVDEMSAVTETFAKSGKMLGKKWIIF